jgi:hypothetical protein
MRITTGTCAPTSASRHCRHARAGCARGPSTGDRLVPHHVTLFNHTGTMSVGDAVPLCEQDHHYLHDDHLVLRLADGRWGPQGWLTQRAG